MRGPGTRGLQSSWPGAPHAAIVTCVRQAAAAEHGDSVEGPAVAPTWVSQQDPGMELVSPVCGAGDLVPGIFQARITEWVAVSFCSVCLVT